MCVCVCYTVYWPSETIHSLSVEHSYCDQWFLFVFIFFVKGKLYMYNFGICIVTFIVMLCLSLVN